MTNTYTPVQFSPYFGFIKYQSLLQVAPQFNGLPLEEMVKKPLGDAFIKDGRALEAKASREDYERLERELIDYVTKIGRSLFIREIDIGRAVDKVELIAKYLNLLQKKFKTDTKKVESLTKSIDNAFSEKCQIFNETKTNNANIYYI